MKTSILIALFFLTACAGPQSTSHEATLTVCADDPALDAVLWYAVQEWNGKPQEYTDTVPTNRLDLLSFLVHELGHQLGAWEHVDAPGAVMSVPLPGGGQARRHPTAADFAALPDDAPALAMAEGESCDIQVWLEVREPPVCVARKQSEERTVRCDEDAPWYVLR